MNAIVSSASRPQKQEFFLILYRVDVAHTLAMVPLKAARTATTLHRCQCLFLSLRSSTNCWQPPLNWWWSFPPFSSNQGNDNSKSGEDGCKYAQKKVQLSEYYHIGHQQFPSVSVMIFFQTLSLTIHNGCHLFHTIWFWTAQFIWILEWAIRT